MHSVTLPEASRRSSRIPFTLPVLVTSLEPKLHFSEVCETLVVNAHGCAVRSPIQLSAGLPLHFHSKDGRETRAYVVDCHPMGSDHQGWRVGARLDQPENFWGVKPCPADWTRLPHAASTPPAPQKGPATDFKTLSKTNGERSLKVVPAKLQEQLSDERLRALIGEVVQPLHAEITSLREKLASKDSKRSQFEVSLSYIPPELEEKLWMRLRQDLGTLVLQLTGEQAEKVLSAARASIGEKITTAQEEFRQRVTEDVQAVEEHTQGLRKEIDAGVREHLRAGLEKFQQHVFDAGNRLERRSEDFYQSLQQRLTEESDARVRALEQVQAAVSLESARLQALVGDLGQRVASLDESARCLETDLDARLERMASEILSGTCAQLETRIATILEETEARNAKALASQLDAACGRLRMTQKATETSVSETLRTQVAETLQSFEQAMGELAGNTVERWRLSLARDLSSVARILGDEVRLEVGSERGKH
jgi:hypothetical protein